MHRSHSRRHARNRINLESLESRWLMASSNRPSPQAQANIPLVYIPIEGPIISQFADSAEVTLKRTNSMQGTVQVVVSTDPPQGASPPGSVQTLGSMTSDLPAVSVQDLSLPVAVAGQHYTPIREVVTFAEGEEARTVAVPLIAGAAGPGERVLPIYVTPASPGVSGAHGTLKLVDRVDVTPPSIVASRLVSPRDGGGIELTFSEPMDPASVENPASYAVSENSHRPNTLDLASFLLSGSVEDHSSKVKITSATYDTAARTVTLGTARPLKAEAQYSVTTPGPRRSGRGRSAPPIMAAKLTDVSGNPLNGGIGNYLASIDGVGRGASRPRGPRAGRS